MALFAAVRGSEADTNTDLKITENYLVDIFNELLQLCWAVFHVIHITGATHVHSWYCAFTC